MPNYPDILRGFARSLTADPMGIIGDTANNVENLGRAGYGYLGSKLGLLSPDQLPELREPKDAPLTSDWLVKNTPLEDTGTAEYATGRLSSMALPLLGGFAARPSMPKATPAQQLGALYPKDTSGIMAVHALDPAALEVKGTRPGWMALSPEENPGTFRNELYQPSFGLTKERPDLSFGKVFLVPNPLRIDPKTSPSVIRATDFFSPRFYDSYAGGGFEMADKLRYKRDYINAMEEVSHNENILRSLNATSPITDTNKEEATRIFQEKIARALAAKQAAYEAAKPTIADVTQRYNDRFGSAFSEGGIFAEGVGQGATRPEAFDPQSFHQLRMSLSPRFQSLEHYSNSPYGGELLVPDRLAPREAVGKVETAWNNVLDTLRPAEDDWSYGTSMPETRKVRLLQMMAEGQFPADMRYKKTGEALGSQQLDILQGFAQSLLHKLKTSPSDYGEVKRFGPMGLNGDNFVGAINTGDPEGIPPSVLSGFAARKIPYFDMQANPKAAGQKILDLQSSVFSKGR